MAESTTQTAPPQVTPPDTTVIVPRADEAQIPSTGDPAEKASAEVKEKMSKTQGFWNRLSPTKEEEKPEKKDKPPEPPPAKAPTKEKEPAAATPSAPTPDPEKGKPKGRKKEQPEIDPMEIARATGQEIGREMAKASANQNVPRGTPTAAQEAEVELPDEFKPDVAVFEEMARMDPKRYGKIKQELGKYAQAESEYIAKWEEEHEGQTYNGDDVEHNAFYAKIQPKYDQKDFKQAQESLIEQKVEKRVLDKIQSREAEAERRREAATKIQPEVEHDMFNTLGEIIKEVDPDNAELAKDWASITKLDEKNPLLSDVMVHVHNETKPIVVAAMRLFRAVEAPDPQNPVHKRLFDMVWKAEEGISRLPIKERYDDEGRLFATQADYANMSPAEKARHWYVGEREALALIRGQAIARTKAIYEQENKKIARYSRQPNAAQPPNPPAEKKTDPAPSARADNGSPTVGGRGTLPGDGQPSNNKPTNGLDLFFRRHLGS